MPAAKQTLLVNEATARQLTLLRACESGSTPPSLWTPQDAAWATRLARESLPSEANPAARFFAERARHAMARLLPRDRHLAGQLWGQSWLTWGLPAAFGLGLAMGLLANSLDPSQRINLLALPLWGLVFWNLCVYAWLAGRALWGLGRRAPAPALLHSWVARRLGGAAQPGQWSGPPQPALRTQAAATASLGAKPNAASPTPSDDADGVLARSPAQRFRLEWAGLSAPMAWARAAVLLHTAAAALGVGLIAGLYLRGLVWDYRAGWQSTFLDAPAVHAVLSTLLAPACALTGLAVPETSTLAGLRLGPDGPGTPALASAALWIHLLAATVALMVVLPRLLLALAAAVQALARARRVALPLHETYYQRLLLQATSGALRVQVVPHGAAWPAAAALGLKAVATALWGDVLRFTVAPTVGYGAEDEGARQALAETQATLRLVCVDLTTTPEAEAHGRLLAALKTGAAACVLVADEAAWRQRFGAVPARLAQRQALWQVQATAYGMGFASIDLERAQAQPELGRAALESALDGPRTAHP